MNDKHPWPAIMVEPIIKAALREDIRSGDITTRALISTDTMCEANFVFREPGVLCGSDVAWHVFYVLMGDHYGDNYYVNPESFCADGTFVEAGQTVLTVSGSAALILTAERVALNFMQRLSGIATQTRRFVEAVAGTRARIVDTRKTTPGLRLLEKYAVRCGGGFNHRFALDDMILIKDNHIALCGGIEAALRRARDNSGHAVKIEIECDTLEQVEEAATVGADIILLDNMAPPLLKQAVEIIGGRATTEASGGVNLDTVRAIAQSGVDLISVGSLTHSVRALDVGLDVHTGRAIDD